VRRAIRRHRSLAEASHAAGFCDQSHMTRMFTRVYGVPPHDGALASRRHNDRTASKRDPHKASASDDARRGTYADAPGSRNSSILLRRRIGPMFMRVNSKCAHQLRPPLDATQS